MRLRIRTTDPADMVQGHGAFLRVEDADTGELLGGVVSVKWELSEPYSIATATIKVMDVALDVAVDEKHHTIEHVPATVKPWVLGDSRLGVDPA